MEKNQRTKIFETYAHLSIPKIEILEIPDDYEFMDEELIEMLTERINESFSKNF
jgi:protein-tyrosine phosphatase